MVTHKVSVLWKGVSSYDRRSVSALMRRSVRAALAACNVDTVCTVCISVVREAEIHRINLEERGVDAPTDVLSFPSFDLKEGESVKSKCGPADLDNGRAFLGDIIISYTAAQRQAEEYEHSFSRECSFLVVHSVLHLLGYDHDKDDERTRIMRRLEEVILDGLGQKR